MDNPTRSERTRTAAIQAALAILERDGPGKLTFDAISRESGISKGGLMHQFRTKGDVLNALMEHQQDYYQRFQREYLAARDPGEAQPTLSAQIATMREVIDQQPSAALAIMAALVEDPAPLQQVRDIDAENAKRIAAESGDPDLALLRWKAAWGLALSAMFGLCPLSADERARLFDRLLDESQWPSGDSAAAPAAKSARKK
ncbi:TetR/AcrR family transcriptional regulator [Burkholderia sp. Ac-20384]|uniref:TetR family transcriptional regulator n=1 Tax=Burkholderia TaxID=32008 RepID=UPI0014538DFB|nr:MULTISPECIES: TetR family transcriptional regulator [Burkholderia]MBN3826489.1 TetR/AcrR family transcriptional regulator [Burkholderia sp. Ac-20384]VWB83441.1 TetR family transcriptional regulator [Burkholderia lata]